MKVVRIGHEEVEHGRCIYPLCISCRSNAFHDLGRICFQEWSHLSGQLIDTRIVANADSNFILIALLDHIDDLCIAHARF
ncbi:hypothetical protein D3C86_1134230 [compost metagenome]